jgi:hypothetical protein
MYRERKTRDSRQRAERDDAGTRRNGETETLWISDFGLQIADFGFRN